VRLTRLLPRTPQVGLFAFRDPFGIRPLVLGHRVSEEGPEWCFASEDCAFGPLGFIKVRPLWLRTLCIRGCWGFVAAL
jgi:glutamine phosphoribosylpyrophosphate amidotransferase